MMTISKAVKQEVNSIIEVGQAILQKAAREDSSFKGDDIANVTSWVTRLGQLIKGTSNNSVFYVSYFQIEEFK